MSEGIQRPPPLVGQIYLDDIVYQQWFDQIARFGRKMTFQASATTTYTVEEEVFAVLGDASSGDFTITLPEASDRYGRLIYVKNVGSSGTVTVGVTGSNTIDGLSTLALSSQWEGALFRSDNTNWHCFFFGKGPFVVSGPSAGSSTDKAVALWDGTSGKVLQNSTLLYGGLTANFLEFNVTGEKGISFYDNAGAFTLNLTGTGAGGEINYNTSNDLYITNYTQNGDIYIRGVSGGAVYTPFHADVSAKVVSVRDATSLRVYDSTNADYLAISHNGTDAYLTAVNSGGIYLTGMTGYVYVNDGSGLRIWDSVGSFGTIATPTAVMPGYGCATEAAYIEIAPLRTGDGAAFIDFHSTTGTDYELRLGRATGANGNSYFDHQGTGVFYISTDGDTRAMSINGSTGYTCFGQDPTAGRVFSIAGNVTGGTLIYGLFNAASIQSDVTSSFYHQYNYVATAAAAFTLTNYYGNRYGIDSIGAGSAITNATAILIAATMGSVPGTIGRGLHSSIASGTNKWNLYIDGTADNYFAGNVGIGDSTPDAKLHVVGTTRLADTGNTDYIELAHDGSHMHLTSANTPAIATTTPIEFNGGVTYDPTSTGAGSDTSATVALAIGSTIRIVGHTAGYIRTLLKWTASGPIEIGHQGTSLITNIDLIPGASGAVNVKGNSPALRVYDAGLTDYVAFSHDGTDFNIAGTNTADINISGISGNVNFMFSDSGNIIRMQDGTILRIYDAADTDFVAFSHDGTDFNIAGTNTTDINLTGVTNVTRDATNARVKWGVWNSGVWGIGMGTTYTYGALNGYAMTFQFDGTAGRGWWWGIDSHTNAQGCMSLDISGNLTIATSGSVGYGISTTSAASNTWQVKGDVGVYDSGGTDSIRIHHDGTSGYLSCTNTSSLWVENATLAINVETYAKSPIAAYGDTGTYITAICQATGSSTGFAAVADDSGGTPKYCYYFNNSGHAYIQSTSHNIYLQPTATTTVEFTTSGMNFKTGAASTITFTNSAGTYTYPSTGALIYRWTGDTNLRIGNLETGSFIYFVTGGAATGTNMVSMQHGLVTCNYLATYSTSPGFLTYNRGGTAYYGLLYGAGSTVHWLYHSTGGQCIGFDYQGEVYMPGVTSAAASTAGFVTGSNYQLVINTSSRKYKKNIVDMTPDVPKKLLQLRPVNYQEDLSQVWGKDGRPEKAPVHPEGWNYYGLIAEEVAEIDERLVDWGYHPDDYEVVIDDRWETGNKITRVKESAKLRGPLPVSVHYQHLPVLMLPMLKDHEARIAALEARAPVGNPN